MAYDDQNIFAKMLRGEVPCDRIYEDEFALAFNDINPQAPVHILVIPKGKYTDMSDFSSNASPEEIVGLIRAVGKVAEQEGLVEKGYRSMANCGVNAHQEVPHLHIHIFGGRALGPMLARVV